MVRKKLAEQILNVKEGAICSICKNPVRGNVNPEKILTCGKCVQLLLAASKESKIALKNRLLELNDPVAARSIESFIIPEANGEIATFKRTHVLRRSNRAVRRVSIRPDSLNKRITEVTEK